MKRAHKLHKNMFFSINMWQRPNYINCYGNKALNFQQKWANKHNEPLSSELFFFVIKFLRGKSHSTHVSMLIYLKVCEFLDSNFFIFITLFHRQER